MVHIFYEKNKNVGTASAISNAGSICHHRLVPRGYAKVKINCVCDQDGASVIPYPWSTQMYWNAEPVVANSFMVWPVQSMAPVLKHFQEQHAEST